MQAVLKMGNRTGVFLGVIAAALLGSAVMAGDTPAQDPVAMADAYQKQAAEYRAQADRHDSMAKMHRAGAGSSKVNHENISRHCDKIAQNLRAAALESDALAATLRKGAEK
jgi:hypothetical protein